MSVTFCRIAQRYMMSIYSKARCKAISSFFFYFPIFGQMCTSNAVSDKSLYPTFARTIFGDNSIGPSVLALMKYYDWDVVAIISEDRGDWYSRANFLESYLTSQGKTVSSHEKLPHYWLYERAKDGARYQDILRKMQNKARSKYSTIQVTVE